MKLTSLASELTRFPGRVCLANEECAWETRPPSNSRLPPKRQRAGAVQDLADFSLVYNSGSGETPLLLPAGISDRRRSLTGMRELL